MFKSLIFMGMRRRHQSFPRKILGKLSKIHSIFKLFLRKTFRKIPDDKTLSMIILSVLSSEILLKVLRKNNLKIEWLLDILSRPCPIGSSIDRHRNLQITSISTQRRNIILSFIKIQFRTVEHRVSSVSTSNRSKNCDF